MNQKSTIPELGSIYKGKVVLAECENKINDNGCVSASRNLKGKTATILVLEK